MMTKGVTSWTSEASVGISEASCNSMFHSTMTSPNRERNGDVTYYKVRYRYHNSWLVNETSVENIYLDNLEPFTEYTIQVRLIRF